MTADQHQTKPTKQKPPLSAYNIFFSYERSRLLLLIKSGRSIEEEDTTVRSVAATPTLGELRHFVDTNDSLRPRGGATKRRKHRKTKGGIAFATLNSLVSRGWRGLDDEAKRMFKNVAQELKAASYLQSEEERRMARELLESSAAAGPTRSEGMAGEATVPLALLAPVQQDSSPPFIATPAADDTNRLSPIKPPKRKISDETVRRLVVAQRPAAIAPRRVSSTPDEAHDRASKKRRVDDERRSNDEMIRPNSSSPVSLPPCSWMDPDTSSDVLSSTGHHHQGELPRGEAVLIEPISLDCNPPAAQCDADAGFSGLEKDFARVWLMAAFDDNFSEQLEKEFAADERPPQQTTTTTSLQTECGISQDNKEDDVREMVVPVHRYQEVHL